MPSHLFTARTIRVIRFLSVLSIATFYPLHETIAERMRADVRTASQRPSLTGAPILSEIAAVTDQRQPLYQAAAQFAVETDRLSLSAVAESVFDWFAGKLS